MSYYKLKQANVFDYLLKYMALVYRREKGGGKMIGRISVIGGDLRQLTLYNALCEEFSSVSLYGFSELDNVKCENDLSAIEKAEAVILPMPVTTDGVNVNSVYDKKPLSLDFVVKHISPSAVVFGGQIKQSLASELAKRGIVYYDYFKREELAVKNAVPTAEGAIGIAINETAYTIHKSECLILGYGRIGKILAEFLRGLGAHVTVCARKYSDLAMAESMGAGILPISGLKEELGGYDIIFNTIPAMVLDCQTLRQVRNDALIIDLASKPGGVDFDAAKESGVKVIWALSLPGKTAPVTAGKIIKDTILNILNELEV